MSTQAKNDIQTLLLHEHTRNAVTTYLSQLEASTPSNLYEMVLSQVEKPLIEIVLDFCNDNQSSASKLLGISRNTLRKKITHYKIKR